MTRSTNSGGSQSGRFPEKDWKHLRVVHAAALERYCTRVIQECRKVVDDTDLTAHERYLRLVGLLRERDGELAAAFDDVRRSRGIQTLAMLVTLDVVTKDELDQFSHPVRESAIGVAKIYST